MNIHGIGFEIITPYGISTDQERELHYIICDYLHKSKIENAHIHKTKYQNFDFNIPWKM